MNDQTQDAQPESEHQDIPSGETATAGDPSLELDEALHQVATVVRREGLRWLRRGAQGIRSRMEQAQSKKDLTLLYTKLGREVERLAEAGELEHPGLLRGVERIRQHRGEMTPG